MSHDVSLNFHKTDTKLQKFYPKNLVFKDNGNNAKFSTTKIRSHIHSIYKGIQGFNHVLVNQ